MRRHHFNAKQQGIAVISAMLIAALVATISAFLLFEHQMLINQIENHFSASQARWMSNAAVEWSRAIMAEDGKLGSVDHLKEPWARRLPATPFETGTIKGSITDQQAFFNLNNLARVSASNNADVQAFKRFIGETGGNPGAVDALIDWMDADFEVTLPNGAEDNAYVAQAAPYKTANQPLTELGNLSRVMGFTNEMVTRTAQYCVVLPESTSVNVNTASAEVLALALPELSQFEIESIISQRNNQAFENAGEVIQFLGDKQTKIAENRIAVGSHYFLVTTQAHYGKSIVNASALLKRDGGGWPQILWKKYT